MLASPSCWAARVAPAASPSKQDCAAAKAAASAAFTAVLRVDSMDPRSNTRTSIPAIANRAKTTINKTAPSWSSWTLRSLRQISEHACSPLPSSPPRGRCEVSASNGEQQTESRDGDEQPPPLGSHEAGGDDRPDRDLRGGQAGECGQSTPDVCSRLTQHSSAPFRLRPGTGHAPALARGNADRVGAASPSFDTTGTAAATNDPMRRLTRCTHPVAHLVDEVWKWRVMCSTAIGLRLGHRRD